MSVYYLRNPDVVLREEDEDGALLFNPDTNEVKAINTTALFVWERCSDIADLTTIVAAIKDAFDDVPEDQVNDQVQTCIEAMVVSGFIGVVDRQLN
ncbi:MAG: PqqD family peptide modification chaperone [Anaerolineales bacterium]|nr:PqqD family peptide modification chaperone [Anaerolineales bacterium]